MVIPKAADFGFRPLPHRRRGVLWHGLVVLARAFAQSQEIRSALLPRLIIRHFLLFFPLGFRRAHEALVLARTFSFHFRLFHDALLDYLFCPRTEIDVAHDHFQHFSSPGAYVVHNQLFARWTTRTFHLFQVVLPHGVINCDVHVERLKKKDVPLICSWQRRFAYLFYFSLSPVTSCQCIRLLKTYAYVTDY